MRLLPLALVLALALPARAEVFNTARTLREGAYSVSGEYQRGLSPKSELYDLSFGYGIVRRLDVGVRLGFDPAAEKPLRYLGADLELGILQDSRESMALSFSAGAHVWDERDVFVDATLLLSKLVFEHLEPYLALDADIGVGAGTGRLVRGVFGLDIPVVKHFELLVETGVGFRDDLPTYASAGFNLYY